MFVSLVLFKRLTIIIIIKHFYALKLFETSLISHTILVVPIKCPLGVAFYERWAFIRYQFLDTFLT